MQVFYAILIVVAALAVGAGVALFTKKVVEGQKELAVQVNKLAGVVGVSIEKKTTGFRDVLSARPPRNKLDILAVSGWTVLQPQILGPLLKEGVEVRALLLDPNSEGQLFEDAPRMRDETLQTIERVAQLRQGFDSFRIRLYRAYQLNTLLFVDDDRLYLSSFRPVMLRPYFVFEIAPGEKSLYQMYRDAFEFAWEHSRDLR